MASQHIHATWALQFAGKRLRRPYRDSSSTDNEDFFMIAVQRL